MSASNWFENALLAHILQNANIANIGDATGLRGSTAVGSLYVSLYTADPGEAGTAITSEATYTGYARVAVARSGAGWTVSGTTSYSNAAIVAFAACTAGSNVITYFGIVDTSTGAGDLLLSGALTASLTVNAGVTPSFAIGAITGTCD